MQPTSANVTTYPGLTQREFRYNKKNEKEQGGGRGYETEKTTQEDLRDRVILILVFSFSNSYWLKPNDCNDQNDVITLFLGFYCTLVIFKWIIF